MQACVYCHVANDLTALPITMYCHILLYKLENQQNVPFEGDLQLSLITLLHIST